jgi:transcriptional regulator with XRE-family HTH domain
MPVYTNAPSYKALELGRRIREERKRLGWTLEDLARRLGISIAALSDLENERTVLNLERLVEIGDALGVAADAFFPRTRSYHFEVSRLGNLPARAPAPRVVNPSTGAERPYRHALRPLADAFVGKHIDPYHIEILPVPDDEVMLISHHHEEFFCVLGGEVECVLETPDGVVRERFGAGDCMYFRSSLPHCLRSVRPAEPARALHVVSSALGASESAPGSRDSRVLYTKGAQHPLAAQAAAKIRELRHARDMSMAEFACEVELSVRQLAALEEGRKAVAIDQLVRICSRFGNPLEYFVAGSLHDKPYYFIQRARDIPALPTRTRRAATDASGLAGEVFKSLADGFGAREMYPYHVTLPDPGATPVHLHEHHGQEFLYVLKGQVTLLTVVDGERYLETLSPGDSCFIDSTAPHRFVSANLNPYDGNSTADVIDVLWCPLGESYLFLDR